MPFRLKLKKTRQYNVASKSLFVISVEMLDGSVADCTLSVDSTGKECLNDVCQRQALAKPELFGLRVAGGDGRPRWVELERPLKRQLDKRAAAPLLMLRVMFYVGPGPGTALLSDEVTRYHFFLQLKSDLVEGRLVCDCRQAVVLAAYSRQAEYGNHDRERHTVEYLKNLLTFPKQIVDGGQVIDGGTLAETGRLEWLTAAVIQHHMSLHNMSQAQAEEGFISVCQSLRYYGQELFSAVEASKQAPITLAISITGITLITDMEEVKHFYRWQDITNVINQKRTFSIECQKTADSVSFLLPSAEEGKYVWRMCVLQHTFYMKHQLALGQQGALDDHRPKFQKHGISESREELDRVDRSGSSLEPLSAAHRAFSTSCLELEPQPHVRALLPSYRPAPDYETAVQQKYRQQRVDVQQAARFQTHHAHQLLNNPPVYGSHPDIHRIHYPDVTRHTVTPNLPYNCPFALNPNVQTELRYVNMYKPPPPYPPGLASNSTPDLQALNYHRGCISNHVSGSSPDLVSTRGALTRHYLGYLGAGPHLLPYGGTYGDLPALLVDRGVYRPPAHRPPYQRRVPLPHPGDTDEPIYENIPLPWRADTAAGRDRAHSLTTTEEMARLNGRSDVHLPGYGRVPTVQVSDANSHYVNAQVIKDVRESSVPRDLAASARSVRDDADFENITLSVERLSLNKSEHAHDYSDETPYQSISTHRVNNNLDNITSILVPDSKDLYNSNVSHGSAPDSGLVNSFITNSTNTTVTTVDSETSTTKTKEKKRRRWAMFIGRGNKKEEVKSATLGRDRAKNAATQPNKHRWSTGLPKFQPLPPSITKETLCQLLERKMSDSQLSFAFEQIPKGRESGADMSTALLPAHAAFNLYSEQQLPYEDNRVRLHPAPHNRSGYINASHITMTVGSSQRFYVVSKVATSCTPAPPPPSCPGPAAPHGELLWSCAWQVGARLVALVGGEERPPHLPPLGSTVHYGKLSVCCETRSVTEWGVTCVVRVSGPHPPGRTLYHVQYSRWPPTVSLPEPSSFLSFLGELGALRASNSVPSTPLHARNAPLVLCCAQGAGRSGVALAADLLLHTLDHNQELDIPRTVRLLHQQRANLIQNVHQYKFLHQILLQYLKHSRLI